jgi:uncharacterized protein YjbJ (UPF0337 family)
LTSDDSGAGQGSCRGSAKQVKGAVKEALDKGVGDANLGSEEKADKAKVKVQNSVGGLKDGVRDAVDGESPGEVEAVIKHSQGKATDEHDSDHHSVDSDFRRRWWILCARSLWNAGLAAC